MSCRGGSLCGGGSICVSAGGGGCVHACHCGGGMYVSVSLWVCAAVSLRRGGGLVSVFLEKVCMSVCAYVDNVC